jgi:hypothetical protein
MILDINRYYFSFMSLSIMLDYVILTSQLRTYLISNHINQFTMKKVLLSILTFVTISFASEAQTRFGVKAGGNLANMAVASSGISLDTKSILAFHVGGTMEMDLSESVFLQPSLLYAQKGFGFSGGSSGITSEATARFNYIELPVNVMYRVTDFLTIGAGPYAAYLLSGKAKGTTAGQSYEDDLDLTESNRLDAGLNLNIGYEVMPSLVINLNYSYGLTNIDKAGETTKNRVLGLSISKFFGQE